MPSEETHMREQRRRNQQHVVYRKDSQLFGHTDHDDGNDKSEENRAVEKWDDHWWRILQLEHWPVADCMCALVLCPEERELTMERRLVGDRSEYEGYESSMRVDLWCCSSRHDQTWTVAVLHCHCAKSAEDKKNEYFHVFHPQKYINWPKNTTTRQ